VVVQAEPDVRPPTRAPGLLLGVGFGGFVDGIVIHQILQWHHMISDTHNHPMTTLAGLEANTVADGVFHLGTWAVALLGVIMMLVAWRQGRMAPTWPFQIGLIIAGWGLFNVVEGLIDHQLLGVHHVRDDLGGPLTWDLGFLTFSVALIVVGWLLHRAGQSGGEHGRSAHDE
jgi:uncharacterized membrane protein